MKIGIDARCLEEAYISGVGEYALEIISQIIKNGRENKYIIFSNSFRQTDRHFNAFEKFPNVEIRRFWFPNKLMNLALWYLHRPEIDRLIGGVDVFFAPNINFISTGGKCRLVTSFHDLSFKRFGEFFSLKSRLWHDYFISPKRITAKSSKLIAVSDSTKNDLVEIYGVKPEKISVVYHGVSGNFRPLNLTGADVTEMRRKYRLPRDFILYLGNIEPRKNIKALLSAHKILIQKSPILKNHGLVLAGNVSDSCRELILNNENVTVTGYVVREDKPLIYNLARLSVYISHFEGFGLPMLEAMACGTPVIASNNASIPEVAGNCALLVNPNKPGELAAAMGQILTDEYMYLEFKARGLKKAAEFSWSSCAEKTQKIFYESK